MWAPWPGGVISGPGTAVGVSSRKRSGAEAGIGTERDSDGVP
jgi:hypothetical protein